MTSLRSSDGNFQPIDLLPVASQSEVFQEGLEAGFGQALEERPTIDPDLETLLEINEFGRNPNIEALDSVDLDLEEVAHAARLHSDRCRIEILAQRLHRLRRSRPPPRE